MIFQVVTHFPERYTSYLETGLPARAHKKGLFQVLTARLKDFTENGRVDEPPYGGGPGMVLQIAPVDRALRSLKHRLPVILFTPRGTRLTQKKVRRFSEQAKGYTLICGYYEGVDERIAEHLVDDQISLGDFVLGSGDLAALCFIEAVTRLLPGYTGCAHSIKEESMENGLLEYPQYTRPREYQKWKVPDILLSGDHKEIFLWREEQMQKITDLRRKEEDRKQEP